MKSTDFRVVASGLYNSNLFHRSGERSLERKTKRYELELPLEGVEIP